MSEKRKDNRGRVLHNGEIQRKDGRYQFKYIDADGKEKFVKEDPHFCKYYEGIYILFHTGLRISEFSCMPPYLLFQHGKVRDESENASVSHGTCRHRNHA